jgi:hypothetical protein
MGSVGGSIEAGEGRGKEKENPHQGPCARLCADLIEVF